MSKVKNTIQKFIKRITSWYKEKPLKRGVYTLLMIYASGVMANFFAWASVSPMTPDSEKPKLSLSPIEALKSLFSKNGIAGIIVTFVIVFSVWALVIKPRTKEKKGELDEERNFTYSDKGTYGTSRWMEREGIERICELKKMEDTKGNILGLWEGLPVSQPTPEEFEEKKAKLGWSIKEEVNNRLNNHVAVFGASGTMKTRSVARPFILQMCKRGESMIITDPKGELYEDMAEYLKSQGYIVRIFDLVGTDMNHSDSWNALLEIKGDATNAKIFADAIIENITDETGYWTDNARNLLKAVCMYVEMQEEEDESKKNMGAVYDIIATSTPEELDIMFSAISDQHPAKRAYNIFKQCDPKVKGQIANGLGIMLEVFQDEVVRDITSHREIDLELPANQKCAYFCVTSDQYKAFDFLAVLFYTMLFIRLVEVADKEPTKRAKVPVNFILDEFPNIGRIPDFCKKISTIRSRGLNVTVIFQNIAQLQNRYPYGQWEEILGNCDTKIFLGCTDETTAKYISNQTGIATIEVQTESNRFDRTKPILDMETSYGENSSTGKRALLNPDEVLQLPNTNSLIFLRGQHPLKLEKCDYTRLPDSKKLIPTKIGNHTPIWKAKKEQEEEERKARIKAFHDSHLQSSEEKLAQKAQEVDLTDSMPEPKFKAEMPEQTMGELMTEAETETSNNTSGSDKTFKVSTPFGSGFKELSADDLFV